MIQKVLVVAATTVVAALSFAGPALATDDPVAPKRQPAIEPDRTISPPAPLTVLAAVTDPCAAYEYAGTNVSLCNDFPGPQDRDCNTIGFRVSLDDPADDPWRLDRDEDGTGCETKPLKTVTQTKSPTPQPSKSATRSVAPSRSPAAVQGAAKLPVTGSPTGLIAAGVGAAAVAAGVITVVMSRRRRTRFEAQ